MVRRIEKPVEKSPGRSPRRDRSPLKDRYRRSPSPRSSRSPRRSWALEKRSPEIRDPPPPPSWPGQDPELKSRKPSRFDSADAKLNVWDRLDEQRTFPEKLRVRTDLEEKFAPQRREFDGRDYRESDRKPTDRPTDRDYHRADDRSDFRRQSPPPRREEKAVFSEIEKDFQDIYKRAVEFRKKTEERQKSGERRREEHDRPKEDERYRPESPRRSRSREREWNTKDRKRIFLAPSIKAKRDKAVDEITNRIINKYELAGEQKYRVTEELRVALSNIFLDMFAHKDVSFIELVIKYQAKYPPKEEDKIMQEVLATLPTHYRNLKRKATGGKHFIANFINLTQTISIS